MYKKYINARNQSKLEKVLIILSSNSLISVVYSVQVKNILKYLFPVPKEDTRRVVTFANQDDFISFRYLVRFSFWRCFTGYSFIIIAPAIDKISSV